MESFILNLRFSSKAELSLKARMTASLQLELPGFYGHHYSVGPRTGGVKNVQEEPRRKRSKNISIY